MTFAEITAFRKDVRRLSRKYGSIGDDLRTVKKVLSIRPYARPPFSYQLDLPGMDATMIKFCKIACKSLKGAGIGSGLNLVYAWIEKEERIIFVGLFHATEKERENIVLGRKFYTERHK